MKPAAATGRNRLLLATFTLILAGATAVVASAAGGASPGRPVTAPSGASAARPAATAGGGTGTVASAGVSTPSASGSGSSTSAGPRSGGPATGGGGLPQGPSASGTSPAPPSDGGGSQPTDASIITPLLRTLAFATDLGLSRVGCNLGGAIVSSVATQLQLTNVLSASILQGVTACGQLAVTAVASLEKLRDESTALAAIDPAIDPLLTIIADNLQVIGTRYHDELAPLGDTLVTLAPTIRYFIGDGS